MCNAVGRGRHSARGVENGTARCAQHLFTVLEACADSSIINIRQVQVAVVQFRAGGQQQSCQR